MPVTYELDPRAALVRTKCLGQVTLADVIAHFRDLEKDPAVPDRLNVLLDLSRMETIPESGELRAVVAEVDRLESRLEWGVCAIVAHTAVLFGISRMFAVFAEEHFSRMQVMRSVDEAEVWLQAQQP